MDHILYTQSQAQSLLDQSDHYTASTSNIVYVTAGGPVIGAEAGLAVSDSPSTTQSYAKGIDTNDLWKLSSDSIERLATGIRMISSADDASEISSSKTSQVKTDQVSTDVNSDEIQNSSMVAKNNLIVVATASNSASSFSWPSLSPAALPVFTGNSEQAVETDSADYIFSSILGRAPSATEVTTYDAVVADNYVGNGEFNYLPAIADVANSQEATNRLQTTFGNDLGSTAPSATISAGVAYLADGVTFSQLVSAITSSSAESDAITSIYQDVLGQTPNVSTLRAFSDQYASYPAASK